MRCFLPLLGMGRAIIFAIFVITQPSSLHAQTGAETKATPTAAPNNSDSIADKGIKSVADQAITPPDFFLRGQLQQGGFLIGKLPDVSRDNPGEKIVAVIYGDRHLTLSPPINPATGAGDKPASNSATKSAAKSANASTNDAREFFIAFDREDPADQQITFVLSNGKKITETFKIKQSVYDIQHVNGVMNKYVNPDAEQIDLIKKQNEMVVALRKTSDETNFSPLAQFIWPAEGEISGIFGSQRVLNGEARNPHYGVDLALKIGTPVRAPQSGKIILAQKFFLSGNTMVIDHGIGVQSVFMHLDSFKVKEGDVVKQGQLVATSGNTGRTTGPHLHWQVNWYRKKFNAQFLPKNQKVAKN
ncbi:MAG: M23 family metallopeptidase [Hydrotalea sp.]|nr:M23 family metallopeptidase [Hydrotalea sp.]